VKNGIGRSKWSGSDRRTFELMMAGRPSRSMRMTRRRRRQLRALDTARSRPDAAEDAAETLELWRRNFGGGR
jgi:hypothetical protein